MCCGAVGHRPDTSLGTLDAFTVARTMLITLGWASLAALFSFSIAMVVWGRNGDGTLNF